MAKDKKSRKIRLLNKFIRVFFVSFILFVVMATIGTYAYVQVASKNIMDKISESSTTDSTDEDSDSTASLDDVLSEEDASPVNSKKITTIAVFGVDEDGYRTDVNMLVFFHHDTGYLDIVSIPRDTKVKIPDDLYEEITSRRSDVSQYARINNIPAYVLSKERNDASVEVLESVFGVDVDYYVNVNLEGFKYIVDAVGPITMDVPIDMDYDDDEQDLHIHLDAGVQELNGSQAEQLIRYRHGYANQDLGRIDTQHLFMQAFMQALLEPDKSFNLMSILNTVLLHVDTNFNDLVDYVVYLDELSSDKISMSTLPGEASSTDGSYVYDQEETEELLESILNRQPEDSETTEDSTSVSDEETSDVSVEEVETVNPSEYTISVQNGTSISGLAGRMEEKLIDAGFDVVEATNYTSSSLEQTIITAPNEEVAEAIAEYFSNPRISVDASMEDDDIQVIVAIGSDDSDQ